MPNLKRNKAMTLRMTSQEYEKVHKKIAIANKKNQTDFFLALLDKKPIIVIEDLRPLLQELKRQGNNLNQITRKLNESNSFGESAACVMNECWKAYQTVAGLESVVRDALIQRKIEKAKPQRAIDYITRPDKAVIVSSLSMNDNRGYAEQFRETCVLYGKGTGYDERKHYHFKLSIDPEDNPTPQQSHELAEKMASRLFAVHECVIATHTDSGTIHSHIIVNAVSFETGKKLHMNNKAYQVSKDLADTLGTEMGFTPLNWRTKTAEKRDRLSNGDAISTDKKNLSHAEQNIDKHGNLSKESWKEALRIAIDEAKAHCTDRIEFQQYLKNYYNVIMPRNTKKTISFVHPAVGERFAIRGTKLGADYTADSIDQALQANKERSESNAGLFIAEEQSIPEPYISTIDSQPTGQDGDGKRSAPRSFGDVSAELRNLDEAVHRITKPVQHGHDPAATTNRKEATVADSRPPEHERSVQQKLKRRSYSDER